MQQSKGEAFAKTAPSNQVVYAYCACMGLSEDRISPIHLFVDHRCLFLLSYRIGQTLKGTALLNPTNPSGFRNSRQFSILFSAGEATAVSQALRQQDPVITGSWSSLTPGAASHGPRSSAGSGRAHLVGPKMAQGLICNDQQRIS